MSNHSIRSPTEFRKKPYFWTFLLVYDWCTIEPHLEAQQAKQYYRGLITRINKYWSISQNSSNNSTILLIYIIKSHLSMNSQLIFAPKPCFKIVAKVTINLYGIIKKTMLNHETYFSSRVSSLDPYIFSKVILICF
jgi:hypothetical protein